MKSQQLIVFARFREGVVGETRRSVHLVSIPVNTWTLTEIPQVITARCGQVFRPGEAERLGTVAGMPCERCLTWTEPPPDIDNGPTVPIVLRRLRR